SLTIQATVSGKKTTRKGTWKVVKDEQREARIEILTGDKKRKEVLIVTFRKDDFIKIGPPRDENVPFDIAFLLKRAK
ncbi:MAG: hypothetical protein IH991_12390, partial [Planctomycetes bacterium]|nr:hypothetical protein [Planctomycetota bacterium]